MNRVKEYRLKLGLSQEALAKKCYTHGSYISLIENENRNVTIYMAKMLCKALNCTLNDLFSDTDGDANV